MRILLPNVRRALLGVAVATGMALSASPAPAQAVGEGGQLPGFSKTVVVERFTGPENPGGLAWLADGVPQTISFALSRVQGVRLITPPTDAQPGDAPVPIPDYTVRGGFQMAGEQVRLTAVVVKTLTTEIVASAEATGPTHDLFAIQDALAAQLHHGMAALVAPPPERAPATPPATEPAPEPAPQAVTPAAGAAFENSALRRAVEAGTSSAVTPAPPAIEWYQPGSSYYGGSWYGWSGWNWWVPGNVTVTPGDGATPDGRDYSRGVGNVMGGQRRSMSPGFGNSMTPGGRNSMTPGLRMSPTAPGAGGGNVMRPPR